MTTPRRLSCHCGAVVLSVRLGPEGLAAARHCNCSFCSRRAAATVTLAPDGLEIVQGEEALRLYQWGSRTAEHYFCGICGIYTHHRRRTPAGEYAVNLGGLEGIDPSELEPLPWFPGRDIPL
ncbi:GFA family protein [Pseudooceanicola sp. C21-150M6]|uniref:GFA family protein n=1 Tax=Pseudooceanicola sp. C21-150M6 TaxID=3434355 RepID=UPI003D7F5788